MLRSKLGPLGLCAVVLGVMAMSAGSAQAALSWLVLEGQGANGKELKALLVGKTDSADLTLLTKLLGKKFAITCTNFELVGVNLEAGGTLTTGGKVKFTGCEAYGKGSLEEALGCNVKSAGAAAGTVESNKGKGALVLHEKQGGGNEVLTKIEPEAGETFGTFLTEECVLPESNPVKGVLYVKDCLGQATTHALEHLIEQGPLTWLNVGSHTAEHLETSIDGSAWIRLGGAHNALKWSAMDA